MTTFRRLLRGFRAALVFLTVIPLPSDDLHADDFAAAPVWFPAVGTLLGVTLVLMHAGLGPLVPSTVGAATLLVTWTALTGGLHLDGFIDCADALPAAVSPERRLTILRDVHVGAYGLVAAVLVLLLQWSCLEALWDRSWQRNGLLLAPVAGRAVIVWAQAGWDYAREEGLGRLVPADSVARIIGLLWVAGVALLGGIVPFIVVAGTIVAAHLTARWMARRLGGGLTGDTYGALCIIAETLVLLGLVGGLPS